MIPEEIHLHGSHLHDGVNINIWKIGVCITNLVIVEKIVEKLMSGMSVLNTYDIRMKYLVLAFRSALFYDTFQGQFYNKTFYFYRHTK